MKTTNPAATLLNILTAITCLVPVGVSVDEMTVEDVADAKDSWASFFRLTPGSSRFPGDGREVIYWS